MSWQEGILLGGVSMFFSREPGSLSTVAVLCGMKNGDLMLGLLLNKPGNAYDLRIQH